MNEILGFNRRSVIFWTLLFWAMQITIGCWSILVWIVGQIVWFLVLLIWAAEVDESRCSEVSEDVSCNQSLMYFLIAIGIEAGDKFSVFIKAFDSKLQKFNNWLDGKQKDDSCPLR
jgi:uncharacterized transporter YbjL